MLALYFMPLARTLDDSHRQCSATRHVYTRTVPLYAGLLAATPNSIDKFFGFLFLVRFVQNVPLQNVLRAANMHPAPASH